MKLSFFALLLAAAGLSFAPDGVSQQLAKPTNAASQAAKSGLGYGTLVSSQSDAVAHYAVNTYHDAMIDSLAKLVSFNTEAIKGQTPDTHPAFIGFKTELKQLCQTLGLDYQDHGYVLLIGLDASEPLSRDGQKLGVITHGDVQPANAALWQQSPYILDTTSEPGKLIGRGTEDDKGAIVTALYAMKSIKDQGIKLNRRIELMVYLAEESDWEPLKAFLTSFTPAEINITIDAEYPIVTAEKGWSQIKVTVPAADSNPSVGAEITAFSGGFFASQIPQQAKAQVRGLTPAQRESLKRASAKQAGMHYQFDVSGDMTTIMADGKAAHSSTPEDGVNAVTHLAQLLAAIPELQPVTGSSTQAAKTVAFIHELIGTGLEAEQFGDIGYRDDFMGPMTLAPTVVEQTGEGTVITMNLRRPIGKTPELLDTQTHAALDAWQKTHQLTLGKVDTYWGEPMVMKDAPHAQTLLNVFSHYTGIVDPKPVAIGGSTNSKLFPNALSFGPAMLGVEYTGHSEKEFITEKQFMLNLQMYTAAFIELAAAQ